MTSIDEASKRLHDMVLVVAHAAGEIAEAARSHNRLEHIVPNDAIDDLRLAMDAWNKASEEFMVAVNTSRRARSGTPKRFRWILAVEIAESVVADGLDLSNRDHVQEMFTRLLPNIRNQIDVEVLASPDPKTIRRAQGYADTDPAPAEPKK